jgi:hypothetical protein
VLADDAATLGAPAPAVQPTASPEPLQVDNTAGRHHHHKKSDSGASPAPVPTVSATPATPVYTTFAGVWEVALQPGSRTFYGHFKFDATDGMTLSGTWSHDNLPPTVVTGEIDGDRFRLAGTDAHGPFTMTGYEESSTTMVGMLLQGTTRTPFTASHESSPGMVKGHAHHRGAKNRSNGAATPAP